MPREDNWLIYGASGFTGRLLAREAVAQGLQPTLAGRSEATISRLGRQLGCNSRVLALDDRGLVRALRDFQCVLMAAGPFSRTSRCMLEACLQAGCHYLDLSGELDAIAHCYRQHDRACAAQVAMVPAVGFSVVPMDCLAAELAADRDRAVALELAFEGYELSAGTAKTYCEGMALGTARREQGRLVRTPLRWQLTPIPFKQGPKHALLVPYGELVSCHRATGIADISVFMVPPRSLATLLKYGSQLSPLLRSGWARQFADRFAERRFRGPGEVARLTQRTQVWARVRFEDGSQRQGQLETPEPYRFSTLTAMEAVRRVRAGAVPPGAYTPSQAFGTSFAVDAGAARIDFTSHTPEAA